MKKNIAKFFSLVFFASFLVGCSGSENKVANVTKNINKRDTITIGLESDVLGFSPWLSSWETTTEVYLGTVRSYEGASEVLVAPDHGDFLRRLPRTVYSVRNHEFPHRRTANEI